MADKESRTEQPTARRRQKARQEGQVPQSGEVTNAAALLGAVLALNLFGAHCFRTTVENVTGSLGGLNRVGFTPTGIAHVLREQMFTVVVAAAPIMATMAVVGVACSMAQTGWLYLPKNIRPRLEAISPRQGLKQMFSLNAIVKLFTSLLKLLLVGVVVYLVLRKRLQWFVALTDYDTWGIVAVLAAVCQDIMLKIALAMILVGLLDYLYQRYKHDKKLMMTKQEKKDEFKNEVGDPKVKQRQWDVRIRLTASRIANSVPTADVVVTNPTHLAVALKWDEAGGMDAPQVVAKGKGYVAARIKEIARDNGVPVLERKELAQALFAAVEVGMQIPGELYYAVAEVLAFVFKRRKGRRRSVTV